MSGTRLLESAKRDVLEELGQPALLLPSLLNSAFEANERAKYLLTLLQTARSQADSPSDQYPSLRDERLAAGVVDPQLDEVVKRSQHLGAGVYLIPLAQHIHEDLVATIRGMLSPFAVTEAGNAPNASRLDALVAGGPDLTGDRVPGAYIDRISTARRDRGDSLHLLIMDAHRALNLLQAKIATSTLDGAAVYGLAEDDGGLISTFMAGVHESGFLQFDHPRPPPTAPRVGR